MDCPIVFHSLSDRSRPGRNALLIFPSKQKDRDLREDALLMVRSGLEVFRQAAGPIEKIVVNINGIGPTFDEMLAAQIARLRLAGADVAGYEPFARYAAAARQGYMPSDHPHEAAMENIFLAIRNRFGTDLGDEQVAARFLEGWERMAARIAEAVARGDNPKTVALFADDPGFLEEHAYLKHDQEAYRGDVRRGRRWKGRIPGEPRRCAVLLLRQPRSTLFKYWARTDKLTPTGEPYRLLVVDWGTGKWVCSTDPSHRISLAPLAERLQRAELKINPSASSNPWYDGASHGGSLIAAPRGGTRLRPRKVARIIGCPILPRLSDLARSRTALLALAGCLCLALGVVIWWRLRPDPVFDRWQAVRAVRLFKGSQHLVRGDRTASFEVHSETPRDVRLQVELKGPPVPGSADFQVEVAVNGELQMVAATARGGAMAVDPRPAHLGVGPNDVRVRVQGGTAPELEAITLSVWENSSEATLHVLTVGVSDYKPENEVGDLQYAHKDALDLAAELAGQTGLYGKVDRRTLVNQNATRGAILSELRELVRRVKAHHAAGKVPNLAVVALAGHGVKDPDFPDRFVFLPYDFDPARPPDETGLPASLLREYLWEVPCPVVLLLDTCASGAMRLRDRDQPSEAREALEKLKQTSRGVILLTACGANQRAREDRDWGGGHGALTWSLLQCMRAGPDGSSGRKVLYFDRVYSKVNDLVERLYQEKHLAKPSVVIEQTGGIPLDTIPLAYVGDGP
jgi:hypothetical protein